VSKRVIVLLAGALAIALVAAGCGGGSSNSTSTASISKAEFEKKGNAICAKGKLRVKRDALKFAAEHHLLKQRPSEAQVKEIAETVVIPGIQRQVNELRALGAPAGEEQQVEETLEAIEEGLEEVKQDPTSAFKSEKEIPAFAKATKLSEGLGLETCGEGG
jgi:hypothetical protein